MRRSPRCWGVALLLAAFSKVGARDAAAALAVRLQDGLSHPSIAACLLKELQEAWEWDEDDEPRGFDLLLEELVRLGMVEAATALAATAAAQAGLINAEGISLLLSNFRQAGVVEAVTALAARAAAQASIDDPEEAYVLLYALRSAGKQEAVATLLARDPAARVNLRNIKGN